MGKGGHARREAECLCVAGGGRVKCVAGVPLLSQGCSKEARAGCLLRLAMVLNLYGSATHSWDKI